MTNFKLIAITPLINCDEQYSKKLEKGIPNLFYNGYIIELSDDKNEIKKVTKPADPVPLDLYRLQNGIDVSISAVVGRNGSGKSTIFELFFYSVYLIYIHKEINGQKILNKESSDLSYYKRKLGENIIIFEKINEKPYHSLSPEELEKNLKKLLEFSNFYKIEIPATIYINPDKLFPYVIEKARLKMLALTQDILDLRKKEALIENGLAVSILYESEGIINEVSYNCGEFKHCHFDPEQKNAVFNISDYKAEDFFYSICINYSHHGLNSNFIGTWINRLFHKNDAYKTPVVINPMRNEGNFNINNEQHLAKERLMANILYDLVNKKKIKLLKKYKISEFVFNVKLKTAPVLFPFELEDFISYPLLQKIGINNNTQLLPFFDVAISYLEHKIKRINEQYHFTIYDSSKDSSESEQLELFLKEDTSHITKKIRQVLNFLEFSVKEEKKGNIFWHNSNDTSISLDPERVKKWLKLSGRDLKTLTPFELIEYGLPGFFHIDFILQRAKSKPISFANLSSGEQQMILNLNGILYHLANLNSVGSLANNKHPENIFGRIIYKNINIILDEIELYYHPEMQRRLISELLNTFEKVKQHPAANGIQSINVTILTHSPFILSDIPGKNVLSLTDESSASYLPESVKTFGGNIQEILMEQFFMDSTLGNHSIKIIQQLIDLYELARRTDNEDQRIKLKEDYLKLEKIYSFAVENVGEEVIREVLSNNLEYILFIIQN